MPRLTEAKVAKLVHEGDGPRKRLTLSNARGLQLDVFKGGRKVWLLRYRGLDGRERRMTLGDWPGWSLDRATKEANALRVAIDRGEDPAADREAKKAQHLTLADFWPRYREHAATGWKASTAALHEWHWTKNIAPKLGKRTVQTITVAEVDRWHQAIAKRAPGNARIARRLLAAVLNYAMSLDIAPTNPVRRVKPLKEVKRERFLNGAELAAVWQAIDEEEAAGGVASVARLQLADGDVDRVNAERIAQGRRPIPRRKDGSVDRRALGESAPRGISPWAAALLRLLILTGCRLNEIKMARWEYYIEAARELRLVDSKTGPKTIHLSEPAAAILTDLKAKRTASNCYIIEGQIDGAPMRCVARPWARVLTRAGAILNQRRREAGLDPIAEPFRGVRVHDMRHTLASTAVGAGMALPIVGKALGHADTRTTSRYAHVAADPVKVFAEEMGSIIMDMVKRPAAVVEDLNADEAKRTSSK